MIKDYLYPKDSRLPSGGKLGPVISGGYQRDEFFYDSVIELVVKAIPRHLWEVPGRSEAGT